MKAIILAAGMGSRLKELTKNVPKCMVEVNGETLIERLLKQVDKLRLDEIIIVLGYKKEVLIKYIEKLKIQTKIKYINNDIYDSTNNIYSLYLTKEDMLNNDVLLIESDLILEEKIFEDVVKDNRNIAVVAQYENWMDGTCVKIDNEKNIIGFTSTKNIDFDVSNNFFKTVNIYKFSKEFNQKYYVPFIEAYISAKGKNEYYEDVLSLIIEVAPKELQVFLNKESWYEIDDKQDLDIASSIFEVGEKKLKKFQNRYGGYWRYPKLIDFCYLVNPYFPPLKMINELKMNFCELLTQYPSGMNVNCLLASKYFNIPEKYIVVGNGAAELIKELVNNLEGDIGIIRPTFEEYPNRFKKQNFISYTSSKTGFKYNAEDIINFFHNKKIDSLIIINPDNPSGNYLNKKEIEFLLNWTKTKGIKIIIDESFVDFSEEENSTLIDKKIIEEFNNLIVVKSISKSYGVPGLRLGVVVSSNLEKINSLKKDVSIWNINSFAEYYMQIFGKYQKNYFNSLNDIKQARKEFIENLKKIEEIEVYDSEANYILIKILEKFSSIELTQIMLEKYNIFIKDLKGKNGIEENYIRVAVRNKKDNELFFKSLLKLFEKGECNET